MTRAEHFLAIIADGDPEEIELARDSVSRQDLGALAEAYWSLPDWEQKLNQWFERKERIVVWGGGTKGVTFSNILQAGNFIPYIVDVNPHKRHKFVPGTGQMIVSPDFLINYKPDRIVVMNGIYEEEIRQSLSQMGLRPEMAVA